MKKIILIAFFFCVLSADTKACDICGCGIGNNYIGILPDFSKHIIGVRYRYNSLLTHVGIGGSTSYLTTTERYQTMEAWAGWNLGTRFRIMASIPYGFNEKINQGLRKTKNGVGDISLSGYYALINSRKTIHNSLLVQSLWVGAGIKAPTGKYNPIDKSNTAESANLFQLGTGSTDFTLNAMYDIRLQDAGISTSASYKINTTNRHEYRYGNKLGVNLQAYYKFRIKNAVTLAPNMGVGYEKGAGDSDRNFTVDISGGNLTMGTVGCELSYKHISVGGNFQVPLSQRLAKGIIRADNRAMLHVSFIL